jgi:hypothetical protein
MANMKTNQEVYEALRVSLRAEPTAVERFSIAADLAVDFMMYNDRPYSGVNCIISNGARARIGGEPMEFTLIFDPLTLPPGFDPGALLATYLGLHFLQLQTVIGVGQYFRVPGKLIRGRDFVGLYTAKPVYFHETAFTGIGPITVYWLVPIFENECVFLDKYGADAFETLLEERDPDMSQYDRLPLDVG